MTEQSKLILELKDALRKTRTPTWPHGLEIVGSGASHAAAYRLWLHPESDCYFWRPAGDDPGDPLCEDVTGYAAHEMTARERGVVPPTEAT